MPFPSPAFQTIAYRMPSSDANIRGALTKFSRDGFRTTPVLFGDFIQGASSFGKQKRASNGCTKNAYHRIYFIVGNFRKLAPKRVVL